LTEFDERRPKMARKKLNLGINSTADTEEPGKYRCLPGVTECPGISYGMSSIASMGPMMPPLPTTTVMETNQEVIGGTIELGIDVGLAAGDALTSQTAEGGALGAVTAIATSTPVLPLVLIGVGGAMLYDPIHPLSIPSMSN